MHIVPIPNMGSSLALLTSIACRMPGGTSCMHSKMMLHGQAMHLIIFLVPCMTLNRNANFCNLIMMTSPPKGKLNHYRCYRPSGSGWNKHYQKQLAEHPF